MKHTTCFCAVAFSLLLCDCAMLRRLPLLQGPPAATGWDSTIICQQALKTAMHVIDGYQPQ